MGYRSSDALGQARSGKRPLSLLQQKRYMSGGGPILEYWTSEEMGVEEALFLSHELRLPMNSHSPIHHAADKLRSALEQVEGALKHLIECMEILKHIKTEEEKKEDS